MAKLLIVDDEALVRIGMCSMVDYAALGIEVIGTAGNGQEAFEIIRAAHPDVVVTDIKMPVMDGLELIARCNAEVEPVPRFIVLTSFDDFDYARRALRANVSDYIIKIEMNAQILTDALKKALRHTETAAPEKKEGFPAQFFNHLLNADFAAEGARYAAAALSPNSPEMLNLAQITLGKIGAGYAVAYDDAVLGILFRLDPGADLVNTCSRALSHICELSRKYFNIAPRIAVGPSVETLPLIARSFDAAYTQLRSAGSGIVFCEDAGSPAADLVRAAQTYIRENVCKRITLGDVSRSVNASPNYLSSLFKKHAGMGFNDYVIMQKVELATRLLREGRHKVYQIAEMLGFDSSYYFSTVYKKYTGQSPSEAIAGVRKKDDDA